jgi:glycosyltransferase involved in cell wall biosynthesis
MKTLKFSVIIPAHNEEAVIERAIKSVQIQSFQNFEIILINDGSTDKTREIVENLMKKDKKIRILNFDKGHSAAFARNRGAEFAKGEILVFLDADTYLEKNCLEEIKKREKLADAFCFPCDSIRINLITKILSGFTNQTKKKIIKEGIYNKRDNNKPLFFCYTKKAYKKLGGYSEKIFYFEDEDLVNRFYKKDFKTINFNTTKQYYELPSTFKEFLRQCKWIGKGINTIPEQRRKNKTKLVWVLKTLFLISPLIFLFKPLIAFYVFLGTLFISYLGLLIRNKKLILSLLVLPFLYIKTFLVTFNIFRFWK